MRLLRRRHRLGPDRDELNRTGLRASAHAPGRALIGLTGAVVACVLAGLAIAPPRASAAATTTVAYWQMDERAGATVMLDSSGNGINGTIGSLVQVGTTYGGATGYRWSYTPPNTPPAAPERLVLVDSSRLNPATADYAVTVRYRTTRSFGNLIQKGQNQTVGGYFKIELPNGYVVCLFKDGSGGQRGVTSEIAINDGQWHTIRCERTQAGARVTIDDSYTRFTAGPTGSISNSKPLSIAGKRSCDQIEVTCDYFVGDIDWVRIESSATTPPPEPPPTGPAAPQFALRTGSAGIASAVPDADALYLYAIGSRGAATLSRTLPTSGMAEPWGLAALPGGGLAVSSGSTDTLRLWDAPATSTSSRTINGSRTRLDWPEGVAADASGYLYVANALDDSVTVYAPGASGNVAPVRRIAGSASRLDEPVGVAVDADGRLLVANSGNDSVTLYAAGADGAAAPLQRILGVRTGLDEPYQVAFAAGGLQVVDKEGTIRAFAPGASGDVAPVSSSGPAEHVLVDPGHGLSKVDLLGESLVFDDLRPVVAPPSPAPAKVAPGAVRALRVHGGTHAAKRVVRWKAPSSTGGAAISGYRVVLRHHGDKLLSQELAARKLVLKRSTLPRGRSKVVVRAHNAIGSGPKARVVLRVR